MNPFEPPKSSEQATEANQSKHGKGGPCFMAAGAIFLVYMAVFSWAEQHRELWLILIALEIGFCAAICGGIGARFGRI